VLGSIVTKANEAIDHTGHFWNKIGGPRIGGVLAASRRYLDRAGTKSLGHLEDQVSALIRFRPAFAIEIPVNQEFQFDMLHPIRVEDAFHFAHPDFGCRRLGIYEKETDPFPASLGGCLHPVLEWERAGDASWTKRIDIASQREISSQ
jgi:hypothetical protein